MSRVVYSFVALAILGPLLISGYVLTLDMVFAPELRMPDQVSSSYLLYVLLHVLNLVIPADVIQKLLLFVVFLLAGLGMHRLVAGLVGDEKDEGQARFVRVAPMFFAGLLYMVNPFTYGRLMAGQYLVLFGYALLPWFVRAVFGLAQRPDWRRALVVAAWATAISIVSIHTIGMALVIAVLVVAWQVWSDRGDSKKLRQLAACLAGVIAVCLLAASYWLLPALAGVGTQAQTVGSITSSDRQAFATSGNNAGEKIANVLGLQGFWTERYDLYILPQQRIPEVLWDIVMLVVIALVVAGAVSWWRTGDTNKQGIVVVFGGSIVVGAILAAGIGGDWLAVHVPFFAGYRESQKFAALIALGYGVLGAGGCKALLHHSPTLLRRQKHNMIIIAGSLLLLPIVLIPTIWWAANGQLRAVHYPASWYTVNQQLNKDTGKFRVLALPWHLYMYLDFAGRTVANPTDNFFDKPVITSDDPELQGAALDKTDPVTRQINALLQTAPNSQDQLGKTLAAINVKYIILTKTSDYRRYDYLAKQHNLKVVADYPEITLYRNSSFAP